MNLPKGLTRPPGLTHLFSAKESLYGENCSVTSSSNHIGRPLIEVGPLYLGSQFSLTDGPWGARRRKRPSFCLGRSPARPGGQTLTCPSERICWELRAHCVVFALKLMTQKLLELMAAAFPISSF